MESADDHGQKRWWLWIAKQTRSPFESYIIYRRTNSLHSLLKTTPLSDGVIYPDISNIAQENSARSGNPQFSA